MTKQQIKQLVTIVQRVAANEAVTAAEALAVIYTLPLCAAPGCGIVLAHHGQWCSPRCRDRNSRDRLREVIRQKAKIPLPTYTLEETT